MSICMATMAVWLAGWQAASYHWYTVDLSSSQLPYEPWMPEKDQIDAFLSLSLFNLPRPYLVDTMYPSAMAHCFWTVTAGKIVILLSNTWLLLSANTTGVISCMFCSTQWRILSEMTAHRRSHTTWTSPWRRSSARRTRELQTASKRSSRLWNT